MKILITGGAGFVGSNLIDLALEIPETTVTSLDNYSTGTRRNHRQKATYVEGNTEDIEAILGTERFDTIFHLGEYSRVEQSYSDWELVFNSNIKGTAEVFRYAIKNCAKIVYAGSSTKFAHFQDDSEHSPYSWTKANNTELLKRIGGWSGLNYAITYFYNAYGEGEISTGRYATLLGIFQSEFERGNPLPVVSPGTQRRNFTHVRDIASGLLLVGLHGSGDGYGIGSDESYSILEVAKMFGTDIRMLPDRKGNRMDASLITEKTKLLGWKPTVSLPAYIEKLKANNVI